jgi:hypothetical protein
MELIIGKIIEKILELAGSGFERVSATLGWSQETQKLGCQVLVLLAGLGFVAVVCYASLRCIIIYGGDCP